jgi:hypothetical protein
MDVFIDDWAGSPKGEVVGARPGFPDSCEPTGLTPPLKMSLTTNGGACGLRLGWTPNIVFVGPAKVLLLFSGMKRVSS